MDWHVILEIEFTAADGSGYTASIQRLLDEEPTPSLLAMEDDLRLDYELDGSGIGFASMTASFTFHTADQTLLDLLTQGSKTVRFVLERADLPAPMYIGFADPMQIQRPIRAGITTPEPVRVTFITGYQGAAALKWESGVVDDFIDSITVGGGARLTFDRIISDLVFAGRGGYPAETVYLDGLSFPGYIFHESGIGTALGEIFMNRAIFNGKTLTDVLTAVTSMFAIRAAWSWKLGANLVSVFDRQRRGDPQMGARLTEPIVGDYYKTQSVVIVPIESVYAHEVTKPSSWEGVIPFREVRHSRPGGPKTYSSITYQDTHVIQAETNDFGDSRDVTVLWDPFTSGTEEPYGLLATNLSGSPTLVPPRIFKDDDIPAEDIGMDITDWLTRIFSRYAFNVRRTLALTVEKVIDPSLVLVTKWDKRVHAVIRSTTFPKDAYTIVHETIELGSSVTVETWGGSDTIANRRFSNSADFQIVSESGATDGRALMRYSNVPSPGFIRWDPFNFIRNVFTSMRFQVPSSDRLPVQIRLRWDLNVGNTYLQLSARGHISGHYELVVSKVVTGTPTELASFVSDLNVQTDEWVWLMFAAEGDRLTIGIWEGTSESYQTMTITDASILGYGAIGYGTTLAAADKPGLLIDQVKVEAL